MTIPVQPTQQPLQTASSALSGFRLPFEGARMLARERRLWGLALVPFLLSLAAFATAVGFVVAYAGELHAFVTNWMPVLEATRWYTWLWIGPAKFGLWVLGGVLFLALCALCLVVAFLVASILAAPFHDALSARVERIVTGRLDDRTASGVTGLLSEAVRSLVQEARKLAYYAAVVVPLVAVGFLVPGLHLVTGPTVVAFTIFFLPLDYASYTLDRRRIAFAERRRWLASHASLMAGFGAAAFLATAVPVLNFVAMPLLVVGGTLLALRHPTPGAPLPDQPAPSSTPS